MNSELEQKQLAEENLPKEKKSKKPQKLSSKPYIVFVEDEREILNFYSRFFQIKGYKIELFSNGKEALKFIYEHADEVNILITDLIMNKGQGLELIDAIRSIELLNQIGIFVISGHLTKELESKLLIRKVSGIYDKGEFTPANIGVKFEHLENQIKEYLDYYSSPTYSIIEQQKRKYKGKEYGPYKMLRFLDKDGTFRSVNLSPDNNSDPDENDDNIDNQLD